MATPLSADKLLRALRNEGLRVVEHRNWRTHNRNHKGPWGPMHGVMIHHTVTSGTASSVELCYNGHSSLPGPLYHIVVAKDGTVYLTGYGRANHAGMGDDDVLDAVIDERELPPDNEANTDGNRHYYGLVGINLGDGKDPWPAAQLEAIERAAAAICRAHGWNAKSVLGHLEWQPGKVDPRGFSMSSMRARIHESLSGAASETPIPTPPKEPTMSAQEELKRLLHTDGVIPAANTSGDRATNKYWVWQTHITDNTNRIRAIHEQSIPALAEEIKKIQTNLANLSSTGITPEQETRIVERILDGLSTRLQS